jgi:hypothetical protein
MPPHSMTGLISGAPGTFSITQGVPLAASRSRTRSISRGCSRPRMWRAEVYAWQGGDAQIRSKPLRSDVSASAWVKVNG